jgi:RNA polymerase sigma factor (sigma-70 family)
VRLDEALTSLAALAPDKAKVVELRYFAGLSIIETATVLNIAPATVKRHWTFARAWLFNALSQS